MKIKSLKDDFQSNQLAVENSNSSISKGEWFGNKKNNLYDAAENDEKVINFQIVIFNIIKFILFFREILPLQILV